MTAIRNYLIPSWNVQIQHVLSEANFCADRLAKLAMSRHNNFELLDNPLEELKFWLERDVLGGSVPRLVAN